MDGPEWSNEGSNLIWGMDFDRVESDMQLDCELSWVGFQQPNLATT